MESNDSLDPLEKLMQQLEEDNETSDSATTTPPAMDLPHRPIMLPPEVKAEPMETETAQVAANAGAGVAIDNEWDVINVALAAPQVAGGDKQTNDLLNATQATENAACSTLDAGDQITAANMASVTVGVSAVSAEQIACSATVIGAIPDLATDAAIASTTTTPACVIRVKTEALEEGELDDCSNESVTAKEVPAPEQTSQQSTEVTRIKAEPIDKTAEAVEQNVTEKPIMLRCRTDVFEERTPPDMVSPNSSTANKDTETAGADETLPDNFFDDLLQNADDITAAALKAPASTEDSARTQATTTVIPNEEIKIKSEPNLNANEPEPTQIAPIPDNFFDDLLVDHVAERIDDVVNHDLEQKFSERLKELEELEAKTSKAHKKHKKKKKKSHKRSHGEAMDGGGVSPDGKHKRSKRREMENAVQPQAPMRIRVKSEFANEPLETINLVEDDEPTTSNAAAIVAQTKQKKTTAPTGRLRIKSEFATFPIEPPTVEEVIPDFSLPVRENELFQRRSNVNRNGIIVDMTAPLYFKRIKMEKDVNKSRQQPPKNLSIADKMALAKQRALDAIEAFKHASKQEKEPMSAIIYTHTLRKLPSSSSFLKQQIYENRSPLNNVNNVAYKFNSHAFRYNLFEWGAEQMPPVAAKVAKVLGIDYSSILKKLETFKMPLDIKNLKKECIEQQIEQKMNRPYSSFLETVATQTDEVTVLDAEAVRRKRGQHKAVQVIPACTSFGTQTLCLTNSSYDELPLMRQISTLNENQLLALSDFVDLITEPVKPESSAIDLYRMRQRLVDIYKCSQEPSALQPTTQIQQQQQMRQQPPVITNINNSTNIRDPRNRAKVAAAAVALASDLDDEPPPPPPLIPALSSARHHPQQQRPPTAPQKVPVIASVQSYHPSSGIFPSSSSMEASSSRYYGRGGMRR